MREPKFAIANARIAWANMVGKEKTHLQVTLTDDGGGKLKGICFRATDSPIAETVMKHDGAPFHIAGRLRLNNWQGTTSPQIMIDDVAPVWRK